MKIQHLLTLIVLLPWFAANSQPVAKRSKPVKPPFMAMFYNVENLFDTQNDPKINDEDFTPYGKVPWTEDRLNSKIEHIGRVMSEINSPSMPDVVGFAEVENKYVLDLLSSSALLSKIKYGIVHFDSPDERGIDVALLYNPATFKVVSSEPIAVVLPSGDKTRDILYVKGKLNSGEILNIFVNHWPSRREGSETSEPRRMAAANVLREKVDELQNLNKSANILIMGDFNDEPSNKSIAQGLKALAPDQIITTNNLYNLLYPEFAKGNGSLYYKDWDLFDQIIVSGNLLVRKKGLHTSVNQAQIFKADYLFYKDKNGELRPNRTMSSDKYFGGYSDHLPVMVKFSVN